MSGINPPPLADLKQRIEAQGVPVEVVDHTKVPSLPPVSPQESAAHADRMGQVMETPEGVPVKHTQIDAEKRHEEVTDATSLSQDFSWFFLGFAYALIPGLDRSLIEVYQAASGKTIPVRTHKARRDHIVDVHGANFAVNPWAWLIQGIPLEHTEPFKAFVASYRFKALPGGTASAEIQSPGEQLWLLDWVTFRIADPVLPAGTLNRAVEVTFALPINTTTGRGMHLAAAPGLLLRRPVFSVRDLSGA